MQGGKKKKEYHGWQSRPTDKTKNLFNLDF